MGTSELNCPPCRCAMGALTPKAQEWFCCTARNRTFPRQTVLHPRRRSARLQLREDIRDGVFVQGLTEVTVTKGAPHQSYELVHEVTLMPRKPHSHNRH